MFELHDKVTTCNDLAFHRITMVNGAMPKTNTETAKMRVVIPFSLLHKLKENETGGNEEETSLFRIGTTDAKAKQKSIKEKDTTRQK